MRLRFSYDRPFPPILLPVGAALIALAVARSPAHAEPQAPLPAAARPAPAATHTRSFVIAASDGYGLADCLSEQGACGRVVADSWCSAQGYGKATSWGRADDMTASIGTLPKLPEKGSLIVTCAE